jgi:hypothetical protein
MMIDAVSLRNGISCDMPSILDTKESIQSMDSRNGTLVTGMKKQLHEVRLK